MLYNIIFDLFSILNKKRMLSHSFVVAGAGLELATSGL